MKRIVILFIFSLIIGILGYLVYRIIFKLEKKKESAVFTRTLQPFEMLKLNGEKQRVNIAGDSLTIIFFFNSDCDHCQSEAKLIRREYERFKNSRLLFLSTESLEKINTFGETYNLLEIPNIRMGKPNSKEVFEKFGVNTLPMVFVYSREGELLKKYSGEVKIEALIQFL